MGASAGGAGSSVLIVEDHDFQRYALVEILKSIGVSQVLEAADGEAALAILDQVAHVDLILCDLDMPGMDGVQFVRRIGELGLSSGLLVTSALDQGVLGAVEAIARKYQLRFVGAVPKPVSAERLSEALVQR